MSLRSHRIAAVAAGATILVGLGSFGAVAAGLIDSGDIKNNSVASVDIKDGSLHVADLSAYAQQKLKGQDGVDGKDGANGVDGKDGIDGAAGKDGANGVDGKDGAPGQDGKDGVSNLIAGAGYTTTWAGDGGAALQTAREECPAGQYALGGGFSTWGGDKDLGGDNKNIQITVSAPYFEGDYVPVDAAGNFRPTEWVVKGYNNGGTDQIVRAWVTCADVTK